MTGKFAKIAVSAATYWIDRPFDYLVPSELEASIAVGKRVYVPFGKGNRRSEGVVLVLCDECAYEKPKPLLAVIDEEPVLSEEMIKLAFFMHERFFCKVYDALKAMLPAGLWLNDDGNTRVNDKTVEMARLCVPSAEAQMRCETKRSKAPQQAALLENLCSFEALATADLLRHTGAKRASLKALEKAGIVELYEREVFRRAANSGHLNKPKRASGADYRTATGFEAVIGMLLWMKDEERLNMLLDEAHKEDNLDTEN